MTILPPVIESDMAEFKYDPDDRIFRKIFETSLLGMAFINPDFYYVKVNEAYCSLMGYSEPELMLLRFSDITHPDHLAVDLEATHQLLHGEIQVYQTEKRYIRKDGQIIWGAIRISVVEDTDRKTLNMIAMVEDITDRKKMEMRLRDNAYLLAEVQKISKVGGWEYDVRTGNSTFTNEVYDILGTRIRSQEEAFQYFYPDHRLLVQESFQKALQKGEPYDVEVRFINAQKKQLWVKTSGTPAYEGGKIVRIIGTLIDITERKHAELEIKRMNVELAESNATKDKFFSIIAHDLRSPFNALLGLTQLIANPEENLSLEETRQIAGRVNKLLNSQFDFLQNLLEWSRLQQGRMEFNPVKVNLYQIASKAVDLLMGNILRKELTIINNIDTSLEICADQEMIRSVFLNLISNAVKFTYKNGKITLDALRDHDMVEIAINDTGVGINEEELDKLFQLETIFTKKGTEGEKGTGLGIILCNDMIEKHHGTIEIYSEVNVGTTVKLCLPTTHPENPVTTK